MSMECLTKGVPPGNTFRVNVIMAFLSDERRRSLAVARRMKSLRSKDDITAHSIPTTTSLPMATIAKIPRPPSHAIIPLHILTVPTPVTVKRTAAA